MARQRRVYQVAEKIRNVIASELFHLEDPRFTLVTITSVIVSADLGHAKVYWVTSGDEERRAGVSEAFENAAGLLRRLVGRELGIRHVPELKFFYDDTLDTTEKVNKLFDRIRPAAESSVSESSEDERSDEQES